MSDADQVDPIEPLVEALLKELGEEPGRDGLLQDAGAGRQVAALPDPGYRQDPREILNDALFDISYDEMVIVKDIEVYSLCEHHLLPFFGRAHVAYLPNGKGLGAVQDPAARGDVRAGACRCRSG